ncbi:MAG: hypothetical protein GY820_13120, partial [Gammaproteobacteria bacterium]|nr:hypothetical protein [Gammaproteobacteria bacterium]
MEFRRGGRGVVFRGGRGQGYYQPPSQPEKTVSQAPQLQTISEQSPLKEAVAESKEDEEESEVYKVAFPDEEKEREGEEEEEEDDDEEEWEDDPEELRVVATTPEALARIGIPVRRRWKPFLVSKSFVRENANMIAKIKQLEQYKQVTMLERAVAEQNMKSMRRAMKRLERLEKNRQ